MTESLCIATPTRGSVRFEWAYALRLLEVPQVPVMFTYSVNYELAAARGRLVEEALAAGCSHLFMVDDDVIPPRDALLRLWKRRNLPFVAGWCVLQNGLPSVWQDMGDGQCKPMSWEWAAKDELISHPDLLTGVGCALVKTEVFFSAIERPFFRFVNGPDESVISPEDFFFIRKLKSAGFKICIDLSVKCGHIQTAVLTPDGERRQLDAGTLQGLILPKREDPAGEVAR